VLFTTSDAKDLTGVNFAPGKEVLAGGISECDYRFGNVGGPINSLTVGVYVAPGDAEAKAAYVKAQAALHGIPLTPINGLGDEAVTAKGVAGAISISAIYVRQSQTFIGLDDESNGKLPSDAAMKAAAELMLSRS
jgi:hypothetical protein